MRIFIISAVYLVIWVLVLAVFPDDTPNNIFLGTGSILGILLISVIEHTGR